MLIWLKHPGGLIAEKLRQRYGHKCLMAHFHD